MFSRNLVQRLGDVFPMFVRVVDVWSIFGPVFVGPCTVASCFWNLELVPFYVCTLRICWNVISFCFSVSFVLVVLLSFFKLHIQGCEFSLTQDMGRHSKRCTRSLKLRLLVTSTKGVFKLRNSARLASTVEW